MTLSELNALDGPGARAEFLRCCGSARWADQMAAGRPYADSAKLYDACERAFQQLGEGDWKEAFGAHRRIGDPKGKAGAGTVAWATAEQSGVRSAGPEILARLKEANEAYEARFGYIFIVCATGKNAAEMLEMLHSRLGNNRTEEAKIAASEQSKITRLRLEKLLG